LIYKEIPYQIASINEKCATDLYIKIRNDYRLLAAKGAQIPEEQLQQFRKSKTKLYIMAQDPVDAEESLDTHLMTVLTHPEVSPKVKADIAYSASMKSIQDVFQGINQRTLSELKKTSQKIVKLILSDNKVMNDFMHVTSSDHFTFTHSVKVGVYGTAMTINLFQDKIKYHDIDELSMAFFLHDIGMTKVPSTILDKNEPLTEGEWETIRKHPIWGHDKLKKANYESDETTKIILYHHERCNGTGYPFKKSGKEIPIYARICAIADTFESLTAARPFKSPKSPFEALKIMQAEMAHDFDPDLFRAFVMLLGTTR
jgi:HD-GYP domain-containing protein (c-di-GMP phosphodiesterase class II)